MNEDTPHSAFPRIVDTRHIEDAPLHLSATAQECAALAQRFALVAINNLTATLTLTREGATVLAKGRLVAAIMQSCAVSAEDLPAKIDEALLLRFAPETDAAFSPDEEIELNEEDCDTIPYSGDRFDLGEAVAQSLALAIDPFAVGPQAEKVRAAGLLGGSSTNPFAVLATLKDTK